jgi:hypothetical protein
MGADLYIDALYEPTRENWEPEFERAARARDEAPDESSRKAAQVRVDHAYGQMHSRGYFRDSYNDGNLLWKFGLSWWTDVIPMLDAKSCLAPEQAACLLGILKEREPDFNAALDKLQPRDQAYFRARYGALQQFLKEAIVLNKPVVCSL